MRIRYFYIVLLIIVFFVVFVFFWGKNTKNVTIHNETNKVNYINTNNIANKSNLAFINDDVFVYYCDICEKEGLYLRLNKDEKILIDTGDISNIIILDDWIYYIKTNYINDYGQYILYRSDFNGENRSIILKDVQDVHIIDGKIYYRKSYFALGGSKNIEMDDLGYIYVCDMNGENIQKLIEEKTNILSNMLVYENSIYYEIDNNIIQYNINSKNRKVILSFKDELKNKRFLICNDILLIKKNNKFIVYNLITEKEEKSIDNIGYVNFFTFDNNKVYFLKPDKTLNIYNLELNNIETFIYTGIQNYIQTYNSKHYVVSGDGIFCIEDIINN